MDYIIETQDLLKCYGPKRAVDHVSLHVKRGDIYGIIGKNGAGKTTLMKLLLGLAVQKSGSIRLFGTEDLDPVRGRIGSLIEDPALYRTESAIENLRRFAILIPTPEERLHELLRFVGLGDVGGKPVRAFSLGMKQRLGIAVALMGNPELMILDEPVNGLDPAGIKEIRDLILELNRKGVTFLISSHLLDELGKIATNYGILANGVLTEEITAAELREQCRDHLSVTVDDPGRAQQIIRQAAPELETEIAGQTVLLHSDRLDAAEVNRRLVTANLRVSELRYQSRALEDFFIERMG